MQLSSYIWDKISLKALVGSQNTHLVRDWILTRTYFFPFWWIPLAMTSTIARLQFNWSLLWITFWIFCDCTVAINAVNRSSCQAGTASGWTTWPRAYIPSEWTIAAAPARPFRNSWYRLFQVRTVTRVNDFSTAPWIWISLTLFIQSHANEFSHANTSTTWSRAL